MGRRDVPVISPTAAYPDDRCLVGALRRGDERAFVALLDQHHARMVRIAMVYVANRAVAEEIVQETWLSVLQGLDRFEARSSLKTWIFRILINRARTRKQREQRSMPFSVLTDAADAPAVDPERFHPVDHPRAARHWSSPPRRWEDDPEAMFLRGEMHGYIRQAIEALPVSQQAVITLRDLEGWTAGEISNLLEISEVNQRVLLHRARSGVRQALERYFLEI